MKQKQTLTPEARLAAAQLPREAWPYALPAGWQWVRLGDIYDINPKNKAADDTEASFITMSDIEAGMVSVYQTTEKPWGDIKRGHTHFADGDVAFAKISPCLENRKSMILHDLKNGIGAGTTELIVLRSQFVDKYYTFWLVNSEDFIRRCVATYSGTVGQQRVSMDFVKNYPVPLPPLSEQRRLVQRIEGLFARLDAAAAKITAASDAAVRRKAAILHAAFTGQLTEQWREEQDAPLNEAYSKKALQDVCKSIFDGDHMPPPKVDVGVPFLVISNVNTGHLNFDDTRFVPQAYYDSLSDTRKPQKGDVLYTLVGSYGISVLVDTDKEFCFQRHMGLLKPDVEQIDSRYLWYVLQTKEMFHKATEIAKGSAQLTVPIKGLRQLTISVPPLPEQREIVRRLDALFAREARASAAIERARTELQRLRTAILARAFRGEL